MCPPGRLWHGPGPLPTGLVGAPLTKGGIGSWPHCSWHRQRACRSVGRLSRHLLPPLRAHSQLDTEVLVGSCHDILFLCRKRQHPLGSGDVLSLCGAWAINQGRFQLGVSGLATPPAACPMEMGPCTAKPAVEASARMVGTPRPSISGLGGGGGPGGAQGGEPLVCFIPRIISSASGTGSLTSQAETSVWGCLTSSLGSWDSQTSGPTCGGHTRPWEQPEGSGVGG